MGFISSKETCFLSISLFVNWLFDATELPVNSSLALNMRFVLSFLSPNFYEQKFLLIF